MHASRGLAACFTFLFTLAPKLLQIAHATDEISEALYSKVLGKDFTQMSGNWRRWITKRLTAILDAAALSQRHLERLQCGNRYSCQPGKDF